MNGPGICKDKRLLWLVFLAWFAVGATVPMQNDSWWHLRTGELIWRTRSVPLVDSYSWVLRPGTFWPDHEWLSQLVFYLVYSVGGLALINLAIGVLYGGLAGLMARIMTGTLRMRALILVLMIPGILLSLAVRPQVFTVFFLALTLYVIGRGTYLVLPPLFFLWVQFHIGVIFGIFGLAAASLAALLTQRHQARSLILWLALTVLCVAANPLGIKVFSLPFQWVREAEMLPLDEWQAPHFDSLRDFYFWSSVVIVVGCAIRYRKEIWRWPSSAYALIGLLCLLLACRHVRDIPLWTVVAGVLCSYLPLPAQPPIPEVQRRYVTQVCVFAVAVLVLVGWCLALPIARLKWYPVSENGLRALRAAAEPQYNSYDVGGYLIWFVPERKVFIDSRQHPYPIAFLEDAIRVQTTGDFETFFRTFGFRSAVVEDWMPLTRALIQHHWRVTYRGRTFTVLEHPSQP